MNTLSCVAVTLLVAGHVASQRVWIVDVRNGPRTDYTDIQAAIDAAAANDVIHVLHRAPSSGFPGYNGFVLDKPLKILGISEFSGVNDIGPILVRGLVEVRGIPAGSEVVLSAIQPRDGGLLSLPPWVNPYGLYVHDCGGRVHIEAALAFGNMVINGIFLVERCADVSFHGGHLHMPGIPLIVRQSTVRFATMVLEADGPIFLWQPYGISTQTEALRVENSEVYLNDVVVWGANWVGLNGSPLLQTPGVVVASGTLYAGPFTVSRGGFRNGVEAHQGGVTTGTGQVVMDPRAVMRHDPLGAFTTRYLCTAEHTFTQHNTPFLCRVVGRPGSIGLLAVGSYQTPGTTLPGLGLLNIDPNGSLVLGIGAMTTQYSYLEFQPTVYGGMPMDHVFAFQGALLHSDGSFELTWPDPFHILWAPGTSYP
jgi:hypothetical protein